MTKQHAHLILWIAMQFLFRTLSASAEDAAVCPSPEKISFSVRTKDTTFADQYQGHITLLPNETLTFLPAVSQPREASTVITKTSTAWDFGDKQKPAVMVFSSPTATDHRYAAGGRTYTVRLSVRNECTNEQISKVREHVKVLYLSGPAPDGRPDPEGFASCDRAGNIPDSAPALFATDSLLYLIRSLRNDIRTRQERIERVRELKTSLKSVMKFRNRDIRAKETASLKRTVVEIESSFDLSADGGALQSMQDLLATYTTGTATMSTDDENDMYRLADQTIATEESITERCSSTLASLEARARRRGNRLVRQIKDLEELSQKPEFDKAKWPDFDADFSGKKTSLKNIDRVTRVTADDLFQTFDDYDQYFFKFLVGYSYTIINKLLQDGTPVVGMVVYRRLNNNDISDSEYGWAWPARYGLHLKFAALFSGSGEQPTEVSDPPPAVTNPGNSNSVGFNEEVFLPLHRSERFNSNKLWEYFGPTALIGVNITQKETDNSTENTINMRMYGGVKFSINPELYADILYGRTSGLYSKRLELRAQMPVYRFSEGSRLFIGAVANFGVKDKVANEADSFNFYMTWNINFDNVFSYFSGKKIDDAAKQ